MVALLAAAGIGAWWLLAQRGGGAAGDWRSVRRHQFSGTYVYDDTLPMLLTVVDGPDGQREFHIRAHWTKTQFWNRKNHLGDGWFAYQGSFLLSADGRVEGSASQHHGFTGRCQGAFPDCLLELTYGGGREGYAGSRDIRLAPWTGGEASPVQFRGQVANMDPVHGWLDLTGTGVGEASRTTAADPAKVHLPPQQRSIFTTATRCEGCSSPIDLRNGQMVESEGRWSGEGLLLDRVRLLSGP